MSDPSPGPRIGMVHDCHYYQHFFDTGSYPLMGKRRDEYSNSGVFLIKPGLIYSIHKNVSIIPFLDVEEFLYLLNLKSSDFMKPNPWETGGEQEFLNEVRQEILLNITREIVIGVLGAKQCFFYVFIS